MRKRARGTLSPKHYDTLGDPLAGRARKALMQALPTADRHARTNAAVVPVAEGVDPAEITSRAASTGAGFAGKRCWARSRKKHPPMARAYTGEMSKVRNVFMSPPARFEGRDTDSPIIYSERGPCSRWPSAGDVGTTPSLHLTPAGIMIGIGMRALGLSRRAGGVGNTELQLDRHRPATKADRIAASPNFLQI